MLTILLSALSIAAYNQDSSLVRDLETWTKIGFEKKSENKKFCFSLSQAFRFDDNSTSLDQFFTELGVGYKIWDDLKFDVGYRLIRDGSVSKGFDKEHRFQTDLSYKHKLNRLRLGYRLRYTNRNLRGLTVAEGDYNQHKYRLRMKAEYNIKGWKLDPYFSAELFYAKGYESVVFNEGVVVGYSTNALQKYRLTLGTDYKTGKVGSLGGFYRIERQFASFPRAYNAKTWYIIGLNYQFKL